MKTWNVYERIQNTVTKIKKKDLLPIRLVMPSSENKTSPCKGESCLLAHVAHTVLYHT